MGNTVSGHTTHTAIQHPIQHMHSAAEIARLAAAHRAAQAAHVQHPQGTGNIDEIMRAAQGEITVRSGTESAHVRTTDTAGQKTAQITIATVWENPALIGPDARGAARGGLPQDLQGQFAPTSAPPSAPERAMHHLLGVEDVFAGSRTPIAEAMQADGQSRTHNSEGVIAIPRERLEAALVAAGGIAEGARIEISQVAGAYKVFSGVDAGAVRSLPSVIIGFEPKEGTDIDALEQVGKRISTMLRQESAVVSLRNTEGPASLIAKLQMSELRDQTKDTEVLAALSREFGGATKTGLNEISAIISFGGDADLERKTEALTNLKGTQGLGIDSFDITPAETRFATGVRIKDADTNRAEYVAKLASEFPRAKESMLDRARDTFDRTWEQLFGAGMRPTESNYVIIDERMRIGDMHDEHREAAPMHWGARMVSLNSDRTGIADIWSSELVLDTLSGRTLGPDGGDPTIGMSRDDNGNVARYAISEDKTIPEGYNPLPKLVKDQGLASPSYFNVGSYAIPVDDVKDVIADSKRLAAASTATAELYTNDTNCLVYAEGLLKDAKPLDSRVASLLECAFTRDFQPAERNPTPEFGPFLPRQVLNQEFNNLFTQPTPGLRAGDSNYSNAVRFLQSIADTTFSGPTERDVTVLAQNLHRLDENQAPTREQIASARQHAADWYNGGLKYELARAPGSDASDVRLQGLHDHVLGAPIRSDHVKPLERTVSSPSIFQSPQWEAPDAVPPHLR